MHVISKKKLKEFWQRHRESKTVLVAWFHTMRGGKYTAFNQLTKTFGTGVDKVGKRIVFDVGGNKYRVITVIHFNRAKVFIRNVLTHKEYDKGKWRHD